MTEAEWLACDDPMRMLAFLSGKVHLRKLRLFACACCRLVWGLMPEDALRRAVALAEEFTEGGGSKAALVAAATEARAVADQTAGLWCGPVGSPAGSWHPSVAAAVAVAGAKAVHRFGWVAVYAAYIAERHARGEYREGEPGSYSMGDPCPQKMSLAVLLRDLCAPHRPPPAARARPSRFVRSIAQAAYEERGLPSGHLDNARLAVLSDALEDAGCADGVILSHLRSPGPHLRGCWALDLVLGKG